MSNYYLCDRCGRKAFDWSPTEVFCSAHDEERPKIIHADNDYRPLIEICEYFREERKPCQQKVVDDKKVYCEDWKRWTNCLEVGHCIKEESDAS